MEIFRFYYGDCSVVIRCWYGIKFDFYTHKTNPDVSSRLYIFFSKEYKKEEHAILGACNYLDKHLDKLN